MLSCILLGAAGISDGEENIPAKDHRYRISGVLQPTCTEKGYTLFTCEKCGGQCRREFAEPLGHTYENKSAAETTCTTDGGVQFTCSVCGAVSLCGYEKAPGHAFGKSGTKEPSCTEEGYTRRICEVCDFISVDEEFPLLGHDYQPEKVVEPSCTGRGYTLYSCTRCGDSYRDDYTKAVGHQYKKQKTVLPTCTEDGYTVFACSRCEKSYNGNTVKAKGHTPKSTGKEVLPTCTNNGYTAYTCKTCGEKYGENFTPALWHDWSESRNCSRCQQGILYRGEIGNIVYFSQWDKRWAETEIGCGTMGKNGCSPSALATALNYRGIKTDPLTVADWLYNNTEEFNRTFTGTSGTGIRLAAEHFGAKVELVKNYGDFLFHLNNGAALVCAQGKGNFSFTGKTHSVFMAEYEDGKAYCCDPYTPPRNGWYETKELWEQRSNDPVDLRFDNVICYAIY